MQRQTKMMSRLDIAVNDERFLVPHTLGVKSTVLQQKKGLVKGPRTAQTWGTVPFSLREDGIFHHPSLRLLPRSQPHFCPRLLWRLRLQSSFGNINPTFVLPVPQWACSPLAINQATSKQRCFCRNLHSQIYKNCGRQTIIDALVAQTIITDFAQFMSGTRPKHSKNWSPEQ
jgi:hypothetical protein